MNISTSYCLSHKYTCKPITSTIHSLFCSIPLSTTLYYTTTTFQSVIRDYFTQLCKVLESQSSLFFPQHMNEFYDESIAIHELYQYQSITDNEPCQFLYDSQSISLSNPVYESFYIFHYIEWAIFYHSITHIWSSIILVLYMAKYLFLLNSNNQTIFDTKFILLFSISLYWVYSIILK